MKIAVTGSSGTVGKATLADLEAHGHKVRAIDLRSTEVHAPDRRRADLTDFGQTVGALDGCEAVVHLGAIPSPFGMPGHQVFATNVLGTYHILEAARILGMKKICLASSVNATGLSYSRAARFDYLPLDEAHPTYNEECYGISKWVGEATADSFARRYENLTISSLRYHGVVAPEHYADWRKRKQESNPADGAKHLWGYVDMRDVVRANRLALEADWKGHEAFFIVAADSTALLPSAELARTFHPGVPLRKPLEGFAGFYDLSKAERLLKWKPEFSWRTG